MSAPEIIDCKIIRRTTNYDDKGVVRPKLYAYSEILMVDANGKHYCSHTWEELKDSPFARAHQIAMFQQRWEMNERARIHR